MKLVIGSDHAGFALKEAVREFLEKQDQAITDVGTDSEASVDYPEFAAAAAEQVGRGEATAGILVCGSGNGVAIAANKVAGVRAVNAHDAEEATMARRHNDINVVTLAGRRLSPPEAVKIVEAFLKTEFEGDRHSRRVAQIQALERRR